MIRHFVETANLTFEMEYIGESVCNITTIRKNETDKISGDFHWKEILKYVVMNCPLSDSNKNEIYEIIEGYKD